MKPAAEVAALVALGAALGATLRATGFGFTGAYRRWLADGDATAVRAQIVMLAAAIALFAPLLAAGTAFGRPLAGFVAPLGLALAFGAFVFGIGMQLAGGCGSGTLALAGAGQPRFILALAAFVAGSFAGSLHQPAWDALPALPSVSLGKTLGWPAATSLQLAALALAWRALGGAASAIPRRLLAGALLLALLNAATLVVAGHPWGITWAFALWGAKLARGLGWDPDGAALWREGWPRDALDAPLLADSTTLMDIGLLLGAGVAALVAGGLGPWRLPAARPAAAAILGGLMMGYGARLAAGCNVGAFFSGVASASLHGWIWIAAALAGCAIGIRLRPRFGLGR